MVAAHLQRRGDGAGGRNGYTRMEKKQAELYTNPGGKFIRADCLPTILAHWRSFRRPQKQSHFIKYDSELYADEEMDELRV